MGSRFSTIRRRRGGLKILGGRTGHPSRHCDRDYTFSPEKEERRQKPRIGNLPAGAPQAKEPIEWVDGDNLPQGGRRDKTRRTFGGGRSDGQPIGKWKIWRYSIFLK